jgi:hypothetical protein
MAFNNDLFWTLNDTQKVGFGMLQGAYYKSGAYDLDTSSQMAFAEVTAPGYFIPGNLRITPPVKNGRCGGGPPPDPNPQVIKNPPMHMTITYN